MNIIYNKISLDIHNIASQLTLAVKKGDTARGLIITLTENGKIYNIPKECYATFSAKKSDGTFVSSGCEIKDNKIIYDFSPQLTKVPGRVDCESSLFSKDDAQITSPLFTLYVYRTIKDEYEEEIASSDEFKTLDRLISEATEVLVEAESTIETANTAITEAEEALSAANESITFIERTEDGKIKLLNFDREEIATVDVFCGDDDTLYRYNDGMLSVVGIKERNKDKTYRMWVGTNAEYVALPEKDPETFYWITDDATFDNATEAFNALCKAFAQFEKDLIEDGKIKAHSAKNAEIAESVDKLEINKISDSDDLYNIGEGQSFIRIENEISVFSQKKLPISNGICMRKGEKDFNCMLLTDTGNLVIANCDTTSLKGWKFIKAPARKTLWEGELTITDSTKEYSLVLSEEVNGKYLIIQTTGFRTYPLCFDFDKAKMKAYGSDEYNVSPTLIKHEVNVGVFMNNYLDYPDLNDNNHINDSWINLVVSVRKDVPSLLKIKGTDGLTITAIYEEL
jgi:hypothetical protein